jgi:hypothetical protein
LTGALECGQITNMKPLSLTVAMLLSLATPVLGAANLLVNPGFEDPITSDGPPFVGFWEGFSGAGASAFNSAAQPHSGSQSLGLNIANTPNTFAGAFQDVQGLSAGTPLSLTGWHVTPSDPLSLGVEIRIEWRNSVSNTEITRTANYTPIPGLSYSQFSTNTVVPVGADTARVVYAIQSFSTSPLGNGTVYVDDMSLTIVPEPASMTLLGLGGLALVTMRRRRA